MIHFLKKPGQSACGKHFISTSDNTKKVSCSACRRTVYWIRMNAEMDNSKKYLPPEPKTH